MIGFPRSRFIRMRYARHYSFASTNTLDYIAFKTNGLVDPSNVVGDHQPLGFDQWQPFYNAFMVIASRIRISATTGSTTIVPTCLGVRVTDVANAPLATTWPGLVEQGKSKYRIIQNAVNGQPINMLSMGWSAKRWFGFKDWKDNTALYAGTLQTSPIADPPTDGTAWFQVFRQPADQATPVAILDIIVVIDYLVAFFEPTEIKQS